MTLAQRVRDHRYAKGWGPDELASRASISRTALYQIESGRTEHPRASTVRRIAEALGVPIEELMMPTLGVVGEGIWPTLTHPEAARPAVPVPIAAPIVLEPEPTTPTMRVRFEHLGPAHRERELERKFREVLASPLGEGLARILEESHRLLPRGYVESGY